MNFLAKLGLVGVTGAIFFMAIPSGYAQTADVVPVAYSADPVSNSAHNSRIAVSAPRSAGHSRVGHTRHIRRGHFKHRSFKRHA